MSDKNNSLDKEYRSFKEFYPFYLSQHQDSMCRTLHFIGSCLILGVLAVAVLTSNPWLLLAVPVVGYGFAWIGHFKYEKNRPATFTYPVYSLMGDWLMFWEILTGKLSMKS